MVIFVYANVAENRLGFFGFVEEQVKAEINKLLR